MKKRLLVLSTAVLLLFGAFSLHSFGDDADPLISKSYFDKKITELEKQIADLIKQQESSQKTASSSDTSFIPLNFAAGESIIFAEGTEFILRSGEAKILDPSTNGLPDITDGSNLVDGSVLPVNHLLLCPRSDNRGIYCQTEIWIMIKGSYAKQVAEADAADKKDESSVNSAESENVEETENKAEDNVDAQETGETKSEQSEDGNIDNHEL